MREIKFRGKRKGYQGWAYGSLIQDGDGCWIVSSFQSGYQGLFDYPNEAVQVIPETVGQYTGIKDIDDIEIWEKDTVYIEIEPKAQDEVGWIEKLRGDWIYVGANGSGLKRSLLSEIVKEYKLTVTGTIYDD